MWSLAMQALKARGEPLLSSFECTLAGIAEYFQPLHWRLTELLSPKYATPRMHAAEHTGNACHASAPGMHCFHPA